MKNLYSNIIIPTSTEPDQIIAKNIRLESRVVELEETIKDLQKKLEENTNVTQELLHFLKHNLQGSK